jgi:hypothetical protein
MPGISHTLNSSRGYNISSFLFGIPLTSQDYKISGSGRNACNMLLDLTCQKGHDKQGIELGSMAVIRDSLIDRAYLENISEFMDGYKVPMGYNRSCIVNNMSFKPAMNDTYPGFFEDDNGEVSEEVGAFARVCTRKGISEYVSGFVDVLEKKKWQDKNDDLADLIDGVKTMIQLYDGLE